MACSVSLWAFFYGIYGTGHIMSTLALQLLRSLGWYLACAVAGAFLAWHFTAGHYQTEIARIESESKLAMQEALTAKADMERQLNAKVSELQTALYEDNAQVDADYANAVSDFTHVLDAHWMQSHNAGGSESVSADTGTAEGNSGKVTAPCKCPADNRAKLQRLFERQMIVARDCDINQNHFKRLVSLYETIRNQ